MKQWSYVKGDNGIGGVIFGWVLLGLFISFFSIGWGVFYFVAFPFTLTGVFLLTILFFMTQVEK